jgi:hypothetical protein
MHTILADELDYQIQATNLSEAARVGYVTLYITSGTLGFEFSLTKDTLVRLIQQLTELKEEL